MKKLNLKQLVKPLFALVATASATYLLINAPQIHGDYIRQKVGSQVVKLTNEENTTGGTGFALKTPNGAIVTVTNAHVCAIANKDGILFAQVAEGRQLPLRVIERSKNTDLCIVQGLSKHTGLSMASDITRGQEVGMVGHPKLQPLTLTRGQFVGYERIVVMVDQGPCAKEEGMYSTVQGMWGEVCVETLDAAATTIPAQGGASGSPVVNWRGQIVGVLFAVDNIGWSYLVSLKDLQTFVEQY